MPKLPKHPADESKDARHIDSGFCDRAFGLGFQKELDHSNDQYSDHKTDELVSNGLEGVVDRRLTGCGVHRDISGKKPLDFIRIAFHEAMQSRLFVAQMAFAAGVLAGGYFAIDAVQEAINQIPISSLCDTVPAVSGNSK